jgi:hypothetical protein
MKKILWFLLLGALTITAADPTGKWAGRFDVTNSGGEKAETAFMDLKLSGNTVTGTVGPNAGEQMAIRNGRLEGNKLTFEVKMMANLFRSTWYLMAVLFVVQRREKGPVTNNGRPS